LLHADLLPEAWIAAREVRQLRALLRYRASLVRLGTQLRNRIHAVAAGPAMAGEIDQQRVLSIRRIAGAACGRYQLAWQALSSPCSCP